MVARSRPSDAWEAVATLSVHKYRVTHTARFGPWLRAILVQAADAAGRTKGTPLSAQYRRLMARRGRNRAAIAVGHTLLVIIYHMIRLTEAGWERLAAEDRWTPSRHRSPSRVLLSPPHDRLTARLGGQPCPS